MNLSVEQINLLKKVIEEEVAIQYGTVKNYTAGQISVGFVKRRLELSDYQETLLRFILTGTETGKLPSEEMRDKLLLLQLETSKNIPVARNNAGSIILRIDDDPAIVVSTNVDKIKLSKLRYVYNLEFSELLNTVADLEDLIAQLRQEVADLKSKLSQANNQNDNLRLSIQELESKIKELNNLIEELEFRLNELEAQLSQLSEDHRKEIERLLEDAKLQLDALRAEKEQMEKQKNEQIDNFKNKIDNFIALENLERDKLIIQDVYRYWVDVENEEVRINKEQVKYDLKDDLQYGAYIIDSLEPTIISDLTREAINEAFDNNDVSTTNTTPAFSTRKIGPDRHEIINPEGKPEPFFATVQVYLREGIVDSGAARLTNESILMIDLLNQNALSQDQTDKLLAFSKRKAPLLQ